MLSTHALVTAANAWISNVKKIEMGHEARWMDFAN